MPELLGELAPQQRELIDRYIGLVLEHNERTNLTADASRDLLLTRHIADGLAAASLLKEKLSAKSQPRLADLGSGGGFIGISIKIAWPEAEVTLIEPLAHRFGFLNAAAVSLGLKGLKVLRQSATGRLAPGMIAFDAVVERALAPLPEALRLGLPLAGPEGLFAAYQSQIPDENDSDFKKALAAQRARLVECWPYCLPKEDRQRYLAVFEKKRD